MLEEKLEMNASNITVERLHYVGDKERAKVVQFLFYKDKINILRNCKKLKETKMSIFEYFSQQTMQIRAKKWKEVLANRKQVKISYLHYRNVICKEGQTPVKSIF